VKENIDMYRIILVSFFSFLLCPAAFLSAQAPAAQAPAAPAPAVIGTAKVAWVDLEQVIIRCEEGKRELAALQQLVDKRTGELRSKQQEAQLLSDQLRIQGDKLKPEVREDLQVQIEAKNIELQRFQEDSQKEVDNRRGRITNSMAKKVIPVVEKLAKEKGLSFVMYLNPSITPWVDPALIITDEVVTAYNAVHPVAAAPEAPAKKP
jgi:Skp family chaperone for outer membrane proteins